MARPRAQDYDDKRNAILRDAGRQFALNGFDRTSMNDIAQGLGISKALLYHYYRAKDDLLFDIIRAHLIELVEAVELADAGSVKPEERLEKVIAAIVECYRDADSKHKVQVNHLGQLPPAQQAELKGFERDLVQRMSEIVGALNPKLARERIRPIAMTIFGALNWKYMWFRDNGAMSHSDYAALLTRMFVAAIAAEV